MSNNKDLVGNILNKKPRSMPSPENPEMMPDIVTEAWLKSKKKRKVQLVVSIEQDLMESIEKIAFQRGVSRSRVVEETLSVLTKGIVNG